MDAILKQKKILKGKLTRLVSKVDDLQNQETSVSIIEVYEIDVSAIDIEINNLNDSILSTCADEDFNVYEMEMHDLFSKLDTLKIILKEEMKKLDNHNTNAWQNIVNTNGEAATLLQSIQITNDSYKKAWNALTERYENETEIINAALNKLISQPILKQESASGLRKLIDTTQQCIDNLQTLRQPVEYWDTLIIFLLRGNLTPKHYAFGLSNKQPKKSPLSPNLNRLF
ncbi:uncharacterized protein TNCV_2530371 [Trichonephila clavipes]|nr:uncharacterized protein TNCV_2530371 [Trichonephila clavipes]